MSDEFNKVIQFDKKINNNVEQDAQGIFYVRLEKDENGNFFNENHLVTSANETDYIVRVMAIEHNKPCVYNYKVSGEKLVEFISKYTDSKNGKVIEVNKCQSNNLA